MQHTRHCTIADRMDSGQEKDMMWKMSVREQGKQMKEIIWK